MKIIKVQSCWSCPLKRGSTAYPEKYWCSMALRMFNLTECAEDDTPEWCPLEEE
jgi:hypothetical protein